MRSKDGYIIAILLILYFSARLFFALQAVHFSDDGSYFALRQIENIAKTGKIISYDELSYGGRVFVFIPLYHYILAAFYRLYPSTIILKIVNNLFASLSIAAAYLVGIEIFKNRKISVVCAILSSLIPIYINHTLNSISSYSLIYPGGYLLIFSFIRLEKEQSIIKYLVPLTVFLVLLSPSSFPIMLGLIIYIIMLYIENIPVPRIYLEYVSFFLFFFMWANFIIFKSALQLHGVASIWSNIPSDIIDGYFRNLELVGVITSIGFLPFILGSYAAYNSLFKRRSKRIFVFISLFFSNFLLFWAKLISAELAILLMSASLAVLFGQGLKDLMHYLKTTKFHKFSHYIFLFILLLLLTTQIMPGLFSMNSRAKEAYNTEYIESLRWIEKNTDLKSVVLSSAEEGNLISYFGKRRNVIDSQYLLIPEIDTRYKEVRTIYTSKFKIEALRLMEKYNVDYILLSEKTKKEFNIEFISYINDECFSLVLNQTTLIYKREKELCTVKTL